MEKNKINHEKFSFILHESLTKPARLLFGLKEALVSCQEGNHIILYIPKLRIA